ncbi:MAG: hypothetical protein ACTSWR_05520 [Candidatus Helarchaeota archaeon]
MDICKKCGAIITEGFCPICGLNSSNLSLSNDIKPIFDVELFNNNIEWQNNLITNKKIRINKNFNINSEGQDNNLNIFPPKNNINKPQIPQVSINTPFEGNNIENKIDINWFNKFNDFNKFYNNFPAININKNSELEQKIQSKKKLKRDEDISKYILK